MRKHGELALDLGRTAAATTSADSAVPCVSTLAPKKALMRFF